MKRNILYILIVICFAACAESPENNNNSSSTESNSSSIFLSQTEIGIFSEGTMVKQFNQQSEQIVFDDDRTIYIISNIDFTVYYTLSFEGGIYLDNSLIVNLESSGISGVENITTKSTVVKVDATDQRYWLWDSDLEVGFIVDFSI